MAGSSLGIRSSVAVATVALNVRLSVVGLVRLAPIAVIPARLVVYCGTPRSVTGWLKTMVITAAALVTLVIPMGVGRATVRVPPSRRLGRFLVFRRPMIPAGMVSLLFFKECRVNARGDYAAMRMLMGRD